MRPRSSANTIGRIATTDHCLHASASPSSINVSTVRCFKAATRAPTQRLAVSSSSGWPMVIAVLVRGLKTDSATIMS